MIYTVTFNPALDYIMYMDGLSVGEVNRVRAAKILCGGKGINVSWVLHNLGVKSVALGFVAGFTGREIERMLQEHGCQTDFVRLGGGLSRINVKLVAGQESDLNAPGPQIDTLEPFFRKLDGLTGKDTLVLAGSLPAGLPENTYEKVLAHVSGARCVVDTTGDALRAVLKFRPFLVKPNHHELGELFGRELRTEEEIADCAEKLRQEGAQNVLVSMAGDGALMAGQDGRIYRCAAPKGTVRGSTGAGDSLVAGFLAGYEEAGSLEYAFRMGVAAGSASAFSEELATREEVYALLETIK
ncbi:MAG: Tagatose-6-phosphate kinase [Desulfovibrio sp.]|uniref:1-phosphofructokinase n=1 Tax=Christensenella intestinihominis TaxID=1851429 RepID=UPI00082EA39C|nr:1-phosphofructokinase [Christensenella intestinihominis]